MFILIYSRVSTLMGLAWKNTKQTNKQTKINNNEVAFLTWSCSAVHVKIWISNSSKSCVSVKFLLSCFVIFHFSPDQGQTTTTGTAFPTLRLNRVSSLTSPANHCGEDADLFAGVIAKAPKFSLVILRPRACWSSLGLEPLTFSAAVRCSTSWAHWVQPVGRCVTSRESFWGEVETPVIFPYSFNCFPRDFISTNTFLIPGNKRLSTFWRNINL